MITNFDLQIHVTQYTGIYTKDSGNLIDHIYVSNGLKVVNCTVVKSGLSDHHYMGHYFTIVKNHVASTKCVFGIVIKVRFVNSFLRLPMSFKNK